MQSLSEIPSGQQTQPVLVLIRGLPGSGKSYLASALQKTIGQDSAVMLDPDATDYDSVAYKAHVEAQNAEGVDPKLHAYRFLRAQAYDGIVAHKIIIWNQPFTNLEIFEKMINGLRAYAVEHGTSLSVLVVEVTVDPAIAKARVEQRKQAGGHGPSDAVFERFVSEYGTAGPAYDIVPIDGQADVTAAVSAILGRIATLRQP